MRRLPFVEHSTKGRRDAAIRYGAVGEGPVVLVADGPFGGPRLWELFIGGVPERLRWLTWSPPHLAARDGGAHPGLRYVSDAEDALSILDVEAPGGAIVLGWSHGANVALEVFRRAPRRVSALILVSPAPSGPWDGRPLARNVGRATVRAARRLGTVVEAPISRALRAPELATTAKRLGVLSPTLEPECWHEVVDALAERSVEAVCSVLEEMDTAQLSAHLEGVDVPTLVIVGDRDPLSSREVAEHVARTLRGAELLTVPGGSHFAVFEFPELVALRVSKFLRERGLLAPGASRMPSAVP